MKADSGAPSYFHTIKSILNSSSILLIVSTISYFHTIKSILNNLGDKYVYNTINIFPYY